MKFLIFFSLLSIQHQLGTPQMLRPPPFNLNRQTGERIIETGNFINPPPPPVVINEQPCNNIVPIPNAVSPSTTLITDCSPAICQNLANTIQLMIVCNLLQNSKSSDLALKLAGPLLNEVMSGPAASCGCPNSISPSIVSPNLIAPNVINPSFIPNLGPNVITPNLYIPSVISPNFGSPNVISPVAPSVISPSVVSLPPRVVAPTGCPNNVISSPANVNGLLNSIMSILGNMRG